MFANAYCMISSVVNQKKKINLKKKFPKWEYVKAKSTKN